MGKTEFPMQFVIVRKRRGLYNSTENLLFGFWNLDVQLRGEVSFGRSNDRTAVVPSRRCFTDEWTGNDSSILRKES